MLTPTGLYNVLRIKQKPAAARTNSSITDWYRPPAHKVRESPDPKIRPNEFKRLLDDLCRSLILLLKIESMYPVLVIDKGDGYVTGSRYTHKVVDRLIDKWHLVTTCPDDE